MMARSLIALVFAALSTATAAQVDQAADQGLVKQREYVARTGDCVACLTANSGKPFAGGLPLQTPIGAIYTTNITPDNYTGIGSWSCDEFVQLMRRGIHKKGYTVYPAMPYPSFSRMSDDDLKSLYAYLLHGVAPVRQANKPPDIVWPISMRWPLTVWCWLFAPTPRPFQPPPGADTHIARGSVSGRGARPLRRLPHPAQLYDAREGPLQQRGQGLPFRRQRGRWLRSRRSCSTAMHRHAALSSMSIDVPAATAPTARVTDVCSRRLPAIRCCRQRTRHPPSTSCSQEVRRRQRRRRLPPSPWRPTTGS